MNGPGSVMDPLQDSGYRKIDRYMNVAQLKYTQCFRALSEPIQNILCSEIELHPNKGG